MGAIHALMAAVLLTACASAPVPQAGRAGAWGYVRLVPREGVDPSAASHAYGEREVAGAAFVDYSRPGFVVVWADGAPQATSSRVAITDGATGPAFDPPFAALGAGGALEVANTSASPRLLSCPRAGLVRRLAPGESARIAVPDAGEWTLFLLDVPGIQARLFAAPGPYRVATAAGRFSFADLPPGAATLHAWHPRFPPAAQPVTLAEGAATRVDLELRVDRAASEAGDAP